jgi:hypothetical protein
MLDSPQSPLSLRRDNTCSDTESVRNVNLVTFVERPNEFQQSWIGNFDDAKNARWTYE